MPKVEKVLERKARYFSEVFRAKDEKTIETHQNRVELERIHRKRKGEALEIEFQLFMIFLAKLCNPKNYSFMKTAPEIIHDTS